MPLLILAGALKAVEAIQQGCELYKEYKGTVLKAKATFDEVKGIAAEVTQVSTSIWGFIKDRFFSDGDTKVKVETKTQQETPQKVELKESIKCLATKNHFFQQPQWLLEPYSFLK